MTGITAPRTVTLDAPQIVGTMKFDSASRYTLSGAGTLTIQVSTGSGSITALNGSHAIAAPIRFASSTAVNVQNVADTLTFSGDMFSGAAVTLTKNGLGKLEVKHLRVDTASIQGNRISILPSAIANAPAGVSRMRGLAFAGSGTPTTTLDLSNNAMVRDYDTASPIGTMRTYLAKGYHGGLWDSTGITSSTAQQIAADLSNSHKTAIGYAEASTLSVTSFFGQTVDSTTVLLMYTYNGDANLDGRVNALDFNAVAANFGAVTSKVWTQGDFNYDGVTNLQDFSALSSNFNQALAGPALGTLVPEPCFVGLSLALLLMGRRRA